MIAFPSEARVWLTTGHTDMRKGFGSLALLVQETLKRNPHAGVAPINSGLDRRVGAKGCVFGIRAKGEDYRHVGIRDEDRIFGVPGE